MPKLSQEDQKKQELYRDARVTNKYDDIWQSVNKCVFCDLKEKYIIYEENGVVITISLYAYIDGHFMIIPRRHVKSAKELTQAEWDTIRKFTYIAKRMIKQVHGIKGVQIQQKDGADAQSTVGHIHYHCIPFDAPDLSVWNYRKLKYTPLENVELYKKASKTIIDTAQRFDKKYKNYSALPVVCDLVIVNEKKQILFQVRSKENKLSPDYLTIPGGNVDNFKSTLEDELVREVSEEIGVNIKPTQVKLLRSQIGSLNYEKTSKQLKSSYIQPSRFMWITYILDGFDSKTKLTPGDDCEALIWLSKKELVDNPKISPEIRKIANLVKL